MLYYLLVLLVGLGSLPSEATLRGRLSGTDTGSARNPRHDSSEHSRRNRRGGAVTRLAVPRFSSHLQQNACECTTSKRTAASKGFREHTRSLVRRLQDSAQLASVSGTVLTVTHLGLRPINLPMSMSAWSPVGESTSVTFFPSAYTA